MNKLIEIVSSFRREKIKAKIIESEDIFKSKTESQLKIEIKEIRNYLATRKINEKIIVIIFSICREIIRRKLGILLYPSQIIGGLVLFEGNIAQMNTGEGKTVTAISPACIYSLMGKKVFITSVNNYLTSRDLDINKKVFDFFDIKSCVLTDGRDYKTTKDAYENNDLIYTTVSRIAYDYLSNNLVLDQNKKIKMRFDFLMIDEIDLSLIDNAQTSLIISKRQRIRDVEIIIETFKADSLARKMIKGVDYGINNRTRRIILKEKGIRKIHDFYKIKNVFSKENISINSFIYNSLIVHNFYNKNVEYVIRKNESGRSQIVLIDNFTGRLAMNTVYTEAMQKALEAKEGIVLLRENKRSSSITLQTFLTLFEKKSGMTGTALGEREEFKRIYGCEVVIIKPNKPLKRIDRKDEIFINNELRNRRVIEIIKKENAKGRPILVSSPSLYYSEIISEMVKKENIKHSKLNALTDEEEANIISNAGQINSVTISTNIAGRGTDIKLSKESIKKNGLLVIGVGRNVIRRIDDQLRGRCSREGQPGESIFLISLEDELFRNYPTIASILKKMIELTEFKQKYISGSIPSFLISEIQEDYRIRTSYNREENFIKDLFVSKQREFYYNVRNEILFSSEIFKIFNHKVPFEYIKDLKINNFLIKRKILRELDNFWSSYLRNIDTNSNVILSKPNFGEIDSRKMFFSYSDKVFKSYYEKITFKINLIISETIKEIKFKVLKREKLERSLIVKNT